MALTGQESAMAALIEAQIEAEIIASTGNAPQLPNNIIDVANGVAKGVIPIIVANLQVAIGIPVTTVGSPTTQSGFSTAPWNVI